jgi:catalase
LFDAVFIPGGEASIEALSAVPESREFLREAYKHCKTIAASSAGVDFVDRVLAPFLESTGGQEGTILNRETSIEDISAAFITAIAAHRHWARENEAAVAKPLSKAQSMRGD